MKLSQNFSSKKLEGIYITPSEVIEYLYCPRFIYYMKCLNIPQFEEKRYKVVKGRRLHEWKKKINKNYLRIKMGVVDKEINIYMSSDKYHIKGIVDEVLFLDDETMAPLDYKFAEYKKYLYRTQKIQSVMYALLIMDNYGKTVNRGYICYTRSNNLIKRINFNKAIFLQVDKIIFSILKIIHFGLYPGKTRHRSRCIDCCYRNICV
ncbi:MAG: CRISPR-associated protein Cas4 [Candidatus Lokiarchaeota archaeon]|nr:CRISPR-associated protein Cas4 [Candidatus Lokiarchaeota archaeon]